MYESEKLPEQYYRILEKFKDLSIHLLRQIVTCKNRITRMARQDPYQICLNVLESWNKWDSWGNTEARVFPVIFWPTLDP